MMVVNKHSKAYEIMDVNNVINFTEWPDEDVYLVADLELIQKIKDSGRHWEPVLGENEELIDIIPDDDFKQKKAQWKSDITESRFLQMEINQTDKDMMEIFEIYLNSISDTMPKGLSTNFKNLFSQRQEKRNKIKEIQSKYQ